MSVTQYIGARYVPLFADPIAWDITQQYEPLTIVYYQGNSYTSKQAVPANIDISNTDYWALTGNYNAQIEQYRAEVQTYDNRITANTTSNTAQDAQLAGSTSSGLKTLIDANATDIDSLEAADATFTAQLAGTSNSGLKTLIDANTSDITTLENSIDSIEDTISNKYEMLFIGDSWGSQLSGQLPTLIARYLNCTLHNYAQASMGFVQGANNFQNQAVTAVNDSNVNADLVKYIVIVGGSNDYSHDITNGGTLASAINACVRTLTAKFKRATIHVFFNWRWRAGNTEYYKLNDQIKVWNYAAQQVANNMYGAICHPESLSWLSKSYFNSEDMVHPTENGNKYFAQLAAISIVGGQMSPYRTNVTTVNLNGYEGITGNLQCSFNEREFWVEVYLNVTAEVSGSHVIKQDTALLPVQLFANPNAGSNSNCLGVPLVKTNGQGAANMSIKFYTSSNGTDQIYIVPQNLGDTIASGYYTGFARMRFFEN